MPVGTNRYGPARRSRARANPPSPRTDASPNDRVRRCAIPRLLRPARALADPAANLLLPPRSPVRVGTAHTTKSTRPHPLLARLMRERLREHSGHLEAQHREAGGDFDSDDDDGTSDAGGDVAGTSRETSPEGRDDDADGSIVDDIVDDFDLHEDDEGGGFDSDAGRREETTLIPKASRSKMSRAQKRAGASATPEGARLVDLVRAEAATRDDAFAETSPSQRRVNALLRMERRAKAEAEALGRGGNPAHAAPPPPPADRRLSRAAPIPTRGPRRAPASSISRGASSGAPPRRAARPLSSPPPPPLRRASRRSAPSAVRPALPREEETLRSRPGRDVQAAHLEEDARDGRGRARARERRAAARGVPPEKRHQRLTRTRRANRRARASGGGERTATDVSARVVDPDAFFSGRRLGEAGEARGLVRARDQSLARH